MIIWINGPFGVGKSQTAQELQARLPGSHIYDPEEIGFALVKTFPDSLKTGDFQDIPLWRSFNHQALKHLVQHHGNPVIVPMTLVVEQYFREVVGALRRDGLEVHHFTLLASKNTILRRLRGRGDGAGSWPAQQLERCLEALQAPQFATHIQAENLGIAEVAESIAGQIGLELKPLPENPLQTRFRRLQTQIKHIRK